MAIQNGGVYSWGSNNHGQLGDATTTNRSMPVPATGLTSGVTAIAAGEAHSLAVQNGGVYAWGYNGDGEVGDGTTADRTTPERIDAADLHDIVAVAAAQSSSYALSSDGSLWVWGDNRTGELGLGTSITSYLTPQHLLPPSGYIFTSINSGCDADHAVATLQAVPEPASAGLLAAASAGGLLLRRRRRCRG